MRINLFTLLGVAAFGGVAFLLLRHPRAEWRMLTENLLGALVVLMLVAIFAGRNRSRAFGVGFVTAALLYLAACFTPTLNFRDKLFTHHALQAAMEFRIEEEAAIAFNSPKSPAARIPEIRMTGASQSPVSQPTVTTLESRAEDEEYFRVGHLLWAMLVGFLGGLIGAALIEPDSTR